MLNNTSIPRRRDAQAGPNISSQSNGQPVNPSTRGGATFGGKTVNRMQKPSRPSGTGANGAQIPFRGQATGNQSTNTPAPPKKKLSTTTYIIGGVVIAIVLVIIIAALSGESSTPPDNANTNQEQTEQTKNENKPQKEEAGAKRKELTDEQNKDLEQALATLRGTAQIVAKYDGLQLKDVTEAIKAEIKKTSRNMDSALGTIDRLTEAVGYPVFEDSQKYGQLRRKLNMMIFELDIAR